MSTLKHRNASLMAAKSRRRLASHLTRTEASAVHDERREAVYSAAVGLAPEDATRKLPPKGPHRDTLADQIRELKEVRGATHLQVAVELGYDVGQVAQVCRDYGIESTKHARRKGYEPLPEGGMP